MPVHPVENPSRHIPVAKRNGNAWLHRSADDCIHIGLINNMPDGALKSTEQQFLRLLNLASGGMQVCLSLFALPDMPRTDAGQCHINTFYQEIENLWDNRLDGLIITGAEPKAPNLTDEPYWGSLTRIVEWAETNTCSSVWSCLAAHAALLHIDGVSRRRLSDKRFGLFECARTSDHHLTAGLPSFLQVPHSRWNDVSEIELLDSGYRILTSARDGSVDMFVKERKSLFVFFQGHPEYDANSLLLEYGRDVGRFLRGERPAYPSMPSNYLDQESSDILAALQERALSLSDGELLGDFPSALLEKRISNTWQSAAVRLYGNWLKYISAQKGQHLSAAKQKRASSRQRIGTTSRLAAAD
jgi:homoserine O-succinyltransferase